MEEGLGSQVLGTGSVEEGKNVLTSSSSIFGKGLLTLFLLVHIAFS